MNDKRFERFAAQHKQLTVEAMLKLWSEQKAVDLCDELIQDDTLNEALQCIRTDSLPRFKELVTELKRYDTVPNMEYTAYKHVQQLLTAEIGKHGRINFIKYMFENLIETFTMVESIMQAIKHEQYDFLRYLAIIHVPNFGNPNQEIIYAFVNKMIMSKRNYKNMFLFLRITDLIYQNQHKIPNLIGCEIFPAPTEQENAKYKNVSNMVGRLLNSIVSYIFSYCQYKYYIYAIEEDETLSAIVLKYIMISRYSIESTRELPKLIDFYECITSKVSQNNNPTTNETNTTTSEK